MQLRDRRKISHIVPVKFRGDRHQTPRIGSGLSNRVVDGDLLELRPHSVDNRATLFFVVPDLGQFQNAREQVRLRAAELLEHDRRLHDEHSRVPQVIAARDVLLRSGEVRLLHEAVHLERRGSPVHGQLFVRMNVAKASCRFVGPNSDRCDVPRLRGSDGLGNRHVEEACTTNDVVRRERADHDTRLAFFQNRGCEANGGRRIARLTFEHDVHVREVGKLFFDGGAVRATGHNHDAIWSREGHESIPRVAKK